jgi:hypothetical protein
MRAVNRVWSRRVGPAVSLVVGVPAGGMARRGMRMGSAGAAIVDGCSPAWVAGVQPSKRISRNREGEPWEPGDASSRQRDGDPA